MLFTIDQINPMLYRTAGFTLGCHILDDCDKDTYGLEQAVAFIKGIACLRIISTHSILHVQSYHYVYVQYFMMHYTFIVGTWMQPIYDYYITRHKVDSVVKDTGRFYHFPIEYVIRHPSISFLCGWPDNKYIVLNSNFLFSLSYFQPSVKILESIHLPYNTVYRIAE